MLDARMLLPHRHHKPPHSLVPQGIPSRMLQKWCIGVHSKHNGDCLVALQAAVFVSACGRTTQGMRQCYRIPSAPCTFDLRLAHTGDRVDDRVKLQIGDCCHRAHHDQVSSKLEPELSRNRVASREETCVHSRN